ncbi:MAG: hypothetical protein M3325_13655, partial [Actinomycetota bacterium]|nr:hypothetical protein [Actinomycetota bacterium]
GTQVKVWTRGPYAAFALADGVARPVFDTEHFTLARGVTAYRPLGWDIDEARDDLFGGLPNPVAAHPKE